MELPQLHQDFPATLCRNRSHAVSPVVSRGLVQTPLEDPELMRTLAEQAAEELADAPAEEVIRWATDTFGSRSCITSSMTDAVIIHLAAAVRPGIDVVFLDTGYHFPETIGTRDAVEVVYPIHLVNVTPSRTVAEQDAELGPRLYGRNPALCCDLRKVAPLRAATGARARWSSWTTGGRWSRSTRSSAGPRSRSTTTSPPMACWSTRWSMTAIPRSAARPARSGSRPAPTRAAAGGPARERPSAASMPERALVAVAHGSAD